LHSGLDWALDSSESWNKEKKPVRMDKVNQALAMFGKELGPVMLDREEKE
jgi:hypothetical protein